MSRQMSCRRRTGSGDTGRRAKGMLASVLAAATLAVAPGGIPAAGAQAVTDACPPDELETSVFGDVAVGSTHDAAIRCVVWWQVAQGRPDGMFAPGAVVERGQQASFLARLIRSTGGPLAASPGDRFPDDDASVHHFAINRLAQVGVARGTVDGRFEPGAPVTRGQLASLLVAAYELRTGTPLPAGDDAFDDDDNSVHEAAIDKAAAAGLANGMAAGRFAPGHPVTRAQAASFLARALQGLVDDGVVPDTPRTLQRKSALEKFDECEALLAHLKERALPTVGPFGLGGDVFVGPVVADGPRDADNSGGGDEGGGQVGEDGGQPPGGPTTTVPESAPAQSSDPYSGTNNQEQGVDEGDIVKTDGRRIVTVVDGRLRIVDVTGDAPRLTATLDLEGMPTELVLVGDRALVLGMEWGGDIERDPMPEDSPSSQASFIGFGRPRSILTLVDLAAEGGPRVTSTMRVDGWTLSTRLVDGVARVVLRSDPTGLPFVQPTSYDEASFAEATRRNREVVEASTIGQWLPRVTTSAGTTSSDAPLVGCENVSRPPEFSGLGLLSVLTVDVGGQLAPGAATSVLAGGDVVYASPDNLYVATSRWRGWLPAGEGGEGGDTSTELHRFDISDPATATYRGSGEVSGLLLNQFSLSEHAGHLRVATTTGDSWSGDETSSQVVVLVVDADGLRQVGSVGGLGRGEQIFAVRFVGDLGYVVTFRRTDPLYVVDLSDPSAPAVRGELKILGYSAYLHPIGDGLLLGVGQDATAEGRQLGTQVSLFDVSDPANPRRLHAESLEGAYSEVEFDHRAFLWWAPTGRAMLPVSQYDVDESTGEMRSQFVGAVGYDVDRTAGITEAGRVTHASDGDPEWGPPHIRRSIVVGDTVYTLSDAGLRASALDDLTDRGWVAFERPPGEDDPRPMPVEG